MHRVPGNLTESDNSILCDAARRRLLCWYANPWHWAHHQVEVLTSRYPEIFAQQTLNSSYQGFLPSTLSTYLCQTGILKVNCLLIIPVISQIPYDYLSRILILQYIVLKHIKYTFMLPTAFLFVGLFLSMLIWTSTSCLEVTMHSLKSCTDLLDIKVAIHNEYLLVE